ncbi:MAG: protein kinase [Bacteroidota bacterium]
MAPSRLVRSLVMALAALAVHAPGAMAQEAIYMIIQSRDSATVYLDGERLGITDSTGSLDVDLLPGSHQLRAEKEGFLPVDQTYIVEPDGVTDIISLAMDPVPPPVPEAMVVAESSGASRGLIVGLIALCALLVGALAFAVTRKRKTGSTFDRYRLVRPIGRGGMATVFLAKDGTDEIALKVMDSGLLGDKELVRKFLKEGEVLQTIAQHAPTAPVVRALRYGRENDDPTGRPFVALEYVPGDTLMKFCRDAGRMPAQQVLGIARQVCEGLAAAHEQGVWHRDVSPDNVLLEEATSGTDAPPVKLIDFGVAKNEYTQAKTLDGSISGKPPYMSPEQCRGESLDGRSDLYAVGVMMYTMLAGHPPFTDTNPLLVMRLHETAPVPPLPDDVPGPVREIVMRLLEKNREDRPASAAEVAAELSALERMN